nr:helix-turn-helix domain-containing protein [uncultured Clostridium sp.]
MAVNKPTYNKSANYKCLLGLDHKTSDLYLNYCGIEYCKPNHKYGHIPRKEHLIHIVTDGIGLFCLNGTACQVNKNQAFYIPPDNEDYHYISDGVTPWSYMWIGFSGSKSNSYLAQTALSVAHPVCTLNSHADDLSSLIQNLLNANSLTYVNELKRTGYLYRIISLLISENKDEGTDKNGKDGLPLSYALYAKEYIDRSYAVTSVTKVAEILGISRSCLYTSFKNAYNISPHEYLVSKKMKSAARLLLETDLSIQMISWETGYADPPSFSKLFKETYGMNPTQYRQKYNKKEF